MACSPRRVGAVATIFSCFLSVSSVPGYGNYYHFMSTGHLLLINAQFEAYGKWLCVNGTSKMWRNLLIVWATDFDLAFNMCDSVV